MKWHLWLNFRCYRAEETIKSVCNCSRISNNMAFKTNNCWWIICCFLERNYGSDSFPGIFHIVDVIFALLGLLWNLRSHFLVFLRGAWFDNHLFNVFNIIVKRKIRIPFINLHKSRPIFRFIISRKCSIIKGFQVTNERIWFMHTFILVKPRNKKYLWQVIWISCC